MVSKLSGKAWRSTLFLVIVVGALGGFALYTYAPSALLALKGITPPLAKEESMSNIYGMSALGLVFCLLALAILISGFVRSVGRRTDRFLKKHPNTNINQLNSDFAVAERFGDVYLGRKFTFSTDIKDIVLEIKDIAWVYSRRERTKNVVSTYICWGLADGSVEESKTSDKQLDRMFRLYGSYPHIEVGNDPELAYLFKNDLSTFLDRKYRENVGKEPKF